MGSVSRKASIQDTCSLCAIHLCSVTLRKIADQSQCKYVTRGSSESNRDGYRAPLFKEQCDSLGQQLTGLDRLWFVSNWPRWAKLSSTLDAFPLLVPCFKTASKTAIYNRRQLCCCINRVTRILPRARRTESSSVTVQNSWPISAPCSLPVSTPDWIFLSEHAQDTPIVQISDISW